MKSIEDLNLLYGEISWDQIYLAIVKWALELMENKYKLLRQNMKFNLPTTTKALLENPTDTLDQIIKMVTQWDTHQVAPHLKNTMDRKRDMGCSYCKQKNHTLEQCKLKKFDRELKDKVAILVSTLLKNHKTLQDLEFIMNR